MARKLPLRPKAYWEYPPRPACALRESVPQRANTYATDAEPMIVTIQAKIDMVPTSASFVGMRMMDEPTMFSIVAMVSSRKVSFCLGADTRGLLEKVLVEP